MKYLLLLLILTILVISGCSMKEPVPFKIDQTAPTPIGCTNSVDC